MLWIVYLHAVDQLWRKEKVQAYFFSAFVKKTTEKKRWNLDSGLKRNQRLRWTQISPSFCKHKNLLQQLKVGLFLQTFCIHVFVEPPENKVKNKMLQDNAMNSVQTKDLQGIICSSLNYCTHWHTTTFLPARAEEWEECDDSPDLQTAQLQSHSVADLTGMILHVIITHLLWNRHREIRYVTWVQQHWTNTHFTAHFPSQAVYLIHVQSAYVRTDHWF